MNDKNQIILISKPTRRPACLNSLHEQFSMLDKEMGEFLKDFDGQPKAAILTVDESSDFETIQDTISHSKELFFCILASQESFERFMPLQTFACVSCVLPDTEQTKTIICGIKKTLELAKNKNTEKNMNELIEKQMKYALMGEMLSSITHQLRQPINAVSAEMIRLKIGGFLGQVDSAFLDVLMENVNIQTQKMSKTISEFLSYFSPAKQKEHFMLSELSDEIVSLHKELLNRLSIGFEIDIPENIEVYGSKSSLLEIIVNFVSNSKDAYENSDKETEKKKIILKAREMGSFVSISVEDFAGGVAPEHLDKVLSAYFTTKSPEKGTGLGLHISKKIIESEFAGSISTQNSENGFLVTINVPKINSKQNP